MTGTVEDPSHQVARILHDQRAARFPPTGRGASSAGSGGEVIPSARISRATSSSPVNRQAIAPRQARAMNIHADELPPRAAVPKSMAAKTRYPQATTQTVMAAPRTSAALFSVRGGRAPLRDPARFPVDTRSLCRMWPE